MVAETKQREGASIVIIKENGESKQLFLKGDKAIAIVLEEAGILTDDLSKFLDAN